MLACHFVGLSLGRYKVSHKLPKIRNVLHITYLVPCLIISLPLRSATFFCVLSPRLLERLQDVTSCFVVCGMEHKTAESRWGGKSHYCISDLVNHNWFAHLEFFFFLLANVV